MRKGLVFIGALTAAIGIGTCIYLFSDSENPRSMASNDSRFESLKACEKQEELWKKAQATVYAGTLPPYPKFGMMQLMGMSMQRLAKKGAHFSDLAPKGWKKYLHRRGALARIKVVPRGGKYSGIFQGAECGLLRLSLTYRPSGEKPIAPGLALKVFRDGVSSANISALVSLDGQGKDFNFFRNPMSNIVPTGKAMGQKMVHKLFSRVSPYPEELLVSDFAHINSQGEKITVPVSPRQLFFVPASGMGFSSDEHDVREDFAKVPVGTAVYQIHALPATRSGFDYSDYTPEMAVSFLKEAEHVADIVTTSEFLASEFGDDGIFFRHQLRP